MCYARLQVPTIFVPTCRFHTLLCLPNAEVVLLTGPPPPPFILWHTVHLSQRSNLSLSFFNRQERFGLSYPRSPFDNVQRQNYLEPQTFFTMLDTYIQDIGSVKGLLWLCTIVPVLVRLLHSSTPPLRQLRRRRAD